MSNPLIRDLARESGLPESVLGEIVHGMHTLADAPTRSDASHLVIRAAAEAQHRAGLAARPARRRARRSFIPVLRRGLVLNMALGLVLLFGTAALAVGSVEAGLAPDFVEDIVVDLTERVGITVTPPLDTPGTDGTPGDEAPGQDDTAPGLDPAGPGNSETTPAVTAPGQTGDTPGQSGDTPGQSDSGPPGQSGDTPGQSDSGPPGQPDDPQDTAPGQDDNPGGTAPGRENQPPAQTTTTLPEEAGGNPSTTSTAVNPEPGPPEGEPGPPDGVPGATNPGGGGRP